MSSSKEKKQIKKGIFAIWTRHLKPFRKSLYILIFLGVLSSIANGFVPYVTGKFFDALIQLSQNQTTVVFESISLWLFLLLIWAFIQLVANNVDWIIDRLQRSLTIGLHVNIQATGFIHMFKLPLGYHKTVHINGELQKVSQAGWRISAIMNIITSVAPQFLSILIGITLAATINVMMAGILLAGVFIYVMLVARVLLPIAEVDSKAHAAWSEGWDDAASSVQQIESVKQASAEDHEIQKVKDQILGKTGGLWKRLEKSWSNINFSQRLIVFLTQLTVFVLSVNLISKGSITVGELVALNGYAVMFFGPFVQLGHGWQTIQNGITAAAQAEDVYSTEKEQYVPENAVSPDKIDGDISFRNVMFQYGPDQPIILNNINLDVSKGEVVAMVGESGVGKSTTISLISGYYFPTGGRVTIDGTETDRFDLKALRKNIAIVPQEVALFNESILENIRYGTFNVSKEDVRRVAKEVHIDSFIEALPEKYDSLVGERGIKLSVGQKQRVSIARAMLRDPAILILDEPTSALDAKTEKVVTEALEKLMEGRTTFVIAHRLSTVRKADKILVFEKGRIVESGKHEELIKKEDGVYRHLYEYQIGLHD